MMFKERSLLQKCKQHVNKIILVKFVVVLQYFATFFWNNANLEEFVFAYSMKKKYRFHGN